MMSLLSNLGKTSIDKKLEQEKWEENTCKYIDVLFEFQIKFQKYYLFPLGFPQ